jgi:signal transduction histidine kinase
MMALYFASIVFSQGELEREIQHHQATERRLRDATAQARRALMAKSDFLAKLSHELKNPLNAVIGYSEILLEDLAGTEIQKRKDLTSIRSAGCRLLGLIDALLELSRLEAGKAELRIEELEFADFFENMVSLSRPSIAASGNKLIVRPPPAGRIVCDLQKLQRVVEGLLSNAAKFTENGALRSRLRCRATHGVYRSRTLELGSRRSDWRAYSKPLAVPRDGPQASTLTSSGSGFLWRIGTAN